MLYTCGIVSFTSVGQPPCGLKHARHQFRQLQEVREAQQRTPPAQDDFRIGRYDVRPLPRNRTEAVLVDAQDQPGAVPVVSLAHAHELPAGEGVERMRYAHKTRRSDWRGCTSF